MKLALYTVGSLVLTLSVITHTYNTQLQFYSTVVRLTTSKGCLLILGNMGLVLMLLLGNLLKWLFLGSLRPIELETLVDRSWVTVTDTLLIMTVFRDDFNARFIAYFSILLFVKVFHWLAEARISYFEQTPHVSISSHCRISAMLLWLLAIDVCFFLFSVVSLMEKMPSSMILFAFEYLLLAFSGLTIILHYCLNLIELFRGQPLESKGAYVMYLEFAGDFVQFVVYMAFFTVIMTFYGLPLHIIRQLYLAFRSFQRRARDVIRYRRATSNLNQRFPDATEEELQQVDSMCIICRDEMTVGKKLPCGHILHQHCLRSWLERQQTCPTCRTSVLIEDLHPGAAWIAGNAAQNFPNGFGVDNNFNNPVQAAWQNVPVVPPPLAPWPEPGRHGVLQPQQMQAAQGEARQRRPTSLASPNGEQSNGGQSNGEALHALDSHPERQNQQTRAQVVPTSEERGYNGNSASRYSEVSSTERQEIFDIISTLQMRVQEMDSQLNELRQRVVNLSPVSSSTSSAAEESEFIRQRRLQRLQGATS